MSDPAEFVCRGAPRDLGLDQGRAELARVRVEARSARRARNGSVDGVARDVRRFFPHLLERIEGLARGARVKERDSPAPCTRPYPGGNDLTSPPLDILEGSVERGDPQTDVMYPLAPFPDKTGDGRLITQGFQKLDGLAKEEQ